MKGPIKTIMKRPELENKYAKERQMKILNLMKYKGISVLNYTKKRIRNIMRGLI